MKILFKRQNVLNNVKLQLKFSQEQAKEASDFIKEIEKGNLNVEVSQSLQDSELGASLFSIKNHLRKIATEEQERSWLNAGLAKFSDILRNKESLNLTDLADDILTNVVKYVNANQGALFILEDENGEEYLEMVACYAYDRKKYLNKRLNIGEGITGQCVLEKEVVYLKEVPSGYIKITSGLGQSTPKAILVSPLIVNEKVFGVLELASFNEFAKNKIDFIKRLSENIAASIKNVRENARIVSLLNESQEQAEALRSQEEEMRQNMEEMQATQEEMERKNAEISRASAEMSSILNGINTTMATIEFTTEGTVLTANTNFLTSMKYRLEDIKGKHHRKFVPQDILESKEYKTFWTTLASGKSITGVFKRIDSAGKTVWLNAIYNPILNAGGEVVKVIKFATDITAEQELIAEMKGIMNGIDATMATIEFTPEGIILNANNNFQKTMKCSLESIRGKHHKMFVPADVLVSDEYRAFWKRLAAGESIIGAFKRVNSEGEIVWLHAIYNPIRNANGEVFKVVKFATDITAEYNSVNEGNEAKTMALL
ncbi:PAS domain-containing protein [Chryseosolibacter indicus]|uniref:PAS domain-containing protein n=1 Tax=Chryseosolibacter indicus TaxID=2782351 RepID=A0ABS5VY78_9BACT|nr:PAS domain-containing protein [Chryseosolibacter indicus]MBT1706350.1 PAS domain-containing protein [Chryseosolibacter indicus]